jgi:uncharacterized protein YjbI with pentapeptide repeats
MQKYIKFGADDLMNAPVTVRALRTAPDFLLFDSQEEVWFFELALDNLLAWSKWNRHSFNEISALGWFGALQVDYSVRLVETAFSFLLLERAKFKTVHLDRVSFEASNLHGALFNSCKLTGCDFSRTQLMGAVFSCCTFEDCTFLNATLPDTKFVQCKGLNTCNFKGAYRLAREGRIPGHTVIDGEIVKNDQLSPSIVAKKGGGRK